MFEIEFSTGKKCVIKEMKISAFRKAGEMSAARASGDALKMQLYMQEELIKTLLVSINGEELGASQREVLDNLFNLTEYQELRLVMEDFLGKAKAPKIKMLGATGEK